MTSPIAVARAPSPDTYEQAVRDLPTDQIHAEQKRLDLSEKKLKETILQLSADEYRHEAFAEDAISENQQVINSYIWRHKLLADELDRRGHSQRSNAGIEL